MRLLLDTCAVLWSVAAPEKLSPHARELLVLPSAEVCVSAISAAEIACGVARGRIELDRHWKLWFRHFVELNQWRVVPVDLNVIEEAYSLPEFSHQDPADRIIVATARTGNMVVVTGDRRMLEYPHVESVI